MIPTTSRRPRRAAFVVGIVALLLAATACSTSTTADRSALVVGATPGVPAAVVADIYRQVLRSAGATVADDTTVGDYRQLLDGVDGGRVSMFGAFDGDLLSRLAPSSTAISPDDVYTDLNRALPQGVSVGDPTTVSDQVQVVVTASLASSSGADALSECARLPAGLPLVGDRDLDAATASALAAAGCRFAPYRRLDSVDAVLAEVRGGRAAGVVSPLSAAGTAPDLTSLTPAAAAVEDSGSGPTPASTAPAAPDPTAIRAQILVPVYSSGALTRDQVRTMNKVAGELTTADLATMAQQVSQRTATRSAVVGGWLAEHGF